MRIRRSLSMAAHVGDQLNAAGVSNQYTAFVLLGQGVEVADFGHAQAVSHIARARFEDALHLPCIERGVKVA